MEKRHDYRDTIREAAELEDLGKQAEQRERKTDAEIAYEMLAMNSAMNVLGMESDNSDLLQLELAQEIMYLQDPQSHSRSDDI